MQGEASVLVGQQSRACSNLAGCKVISVLGSEMWHRGATAAVGV